MQIKSKITRVLFYISRAFDYFSSWNCSYYSLNRHSHLTSIATLFHGRALGRMCTFSRQREKLCLLPISLWISRETCSHYISFVYFIVDILQLNCLSKFMLFFSIIFLPIYFKVLEKWIWNRSHCWGSFVKFILHYDWLSSEVFFYGRRPRRTLFIFLRILFSPLFRQWRKKQPTRLLFQFMLILLYYNLGCSTLSTNSIANPTNTITASLHRGNQWHRAIC